MRYKASVMKNKLGWYHLVTSACKERLMSDSPGLVDFAITLVNPVFNLPNGQVIFFEEF